MIDHLPQLTNILGTHTSPAAIGDLMGGANLTSHIVKGSNSTPLPTEVKAAVGIKPASRYYFDTSTQRQPQLSFPAMATSVTANTAGLTSSAAKDTPAPVTMTGPGPDQSWAYQPVSTINATPPVLGIGSPLQTA